VFSPAHLVTNSEHSQKIHTLGNRGSLTNGATYTVSPAHDQRGTALCSEFVTSKSTHEIFHIILSEHMTLL